MSPQPPHPSFAPRSRMLPKWHCQESCITELWWGPGDEEVMSSGGDLPVRAGAEAARGRGQQTTLCCC